MWYLYKQQLTSGSPTLIKESDSLDDLKREANRLATIDGCLEHLWDCPPDLKNYELFVGYKFIIRDSKTS